MFSRLSGNGPVACSALHEGFILACSGSAAPVAVNRSASFSGRFAHRQFFVVAKGVPSAEGSNLARETLDFNV